MSTDSPIEGKPSLSPSHPAAGGEGGAEEGTPLQAAQEEETAVVQEEEFDRERALALIRKQREEVKNLKKSQRELMEALRSYQEEEAKQKEAQMSEVERLSSRLQELQEAYQNQVEKMTQYVLSTQVQSISAQMGAFDPELILALLPKEKVEWEEGQPTNLKALIKEMIAAKPYLAKMPAPSLTPNPDASRTASEEASSAKEEMRRRREVYGEGASPFSPEARRRLGGGVFFRDKA